MATLNAPLKITIYGPDDEVVAEHECNRVRWGVLKAAIRMARTFDTENPSEDDIDGLAVLVVEAFGGKFTVKELENSDIGEMGAVLTQIVAKAGALMKSNPTGREG